jgi:stringent starvation protein B
MSSFEPEVPSTRPYLIRALHEWCADNGFSPYIAVQVDASTRVPMEFVKNGEIVLNVSMDATSALKLGNEFIEFKARFGGVAREIIVPVSHVIAIYARENGQGMAFPAPAPTAQSATPPAHAAPPIESADKPQGGTADAARGASLRSVPAESSTVDPGDPPKGPDRPGGRPQLKRVK